MSQESVTPVLSVCIPYYRGDAFIAHCIGSVHSQTIDGQGAVIERGLVEVIVTSDDSSPEARDILGRLATCFNVQVHFNDRPLGLTGNWSAALSRGRGEVVTLLHQDDWYNPGALEKIVAAFRDRPERVLLATNGVLVGAKVREHLNTPSYDMTGAEALEDLDGMGIVYAPSVVFFRRAALAKLGEFYSAAYRWSPERELYRNLAAANPDGLFSYLAHPAVSRGLGEGRFSVNNEELRILDILTYMERNAPFNPAKRAEFITRIRAIIAKRLDLLLKQPRVSQIQELVRQRSWLRTILADPRMVHVFEDGGEELLALLRANCKPSVNVSYFCREAMLSSPLPARLAQPDLTAELESMLTPDAEERQRVMARVPRILDSAEFRRPVIICGFHHSGTRLLAAALDAVGVFQHVNSPTHEWSFFQVINTIMLPGWMDPKAIDAYDGAGHEEIDPANLAMRLSAAGYLGHGPWGQKDPRNSVTADAWLRAFPEARIVNITRDPLDVLGTLPEGYTPFSPQGLRPQEEPEFWSELWLAYLRKTRAAMARAGRSVEVRFEDLCAQPVETLQTIITALDLDCNVAPADLTHLNIQPSKVGVHRDWVEQGKLSPESLAVLERCVGNALESPSLRDRG